MKMTILDVQFQRQCDFNSFVRRLERLKSVESVSHSPYREDPLWRKVDVTHDESMDRDKWDTWLYETKIKGLDGYGTVDTVDCEDELTERVSMANEVYTQIQKLYTYKGSFCVNHADLSRHIKDNSIDTDCPSIHKHSGYECSFDDSLYVFIYSDNSVLIVNCNGSLSAY